MVEMTEIVRGDGMKYALAYNEFHNLESIGIKGKSEALIKYAYKNGNGRLKQMTYANGDKMKATYNSLGQMVAETWYDANNVEKARYKISLVFVCSGKITMPIIAVIYLSLILAIWIPVLVKLVHTYKEKRDFEKDMQNLNI